MNWRKAHMAIGVLGVIAFVATGQYMLWVHNGLRGLEDGPRLFFRSAHIYLLSSSLLNVLLGTYFAPLERGLRRWLQVIGSLAILAGPPMVTFSFFGERYGPDLLRPIGQLAIFLGVIGVALHALAWRARGGPA